MCHPCGLEFGARGTLGSHIRWTHRIEAVKFLNVFKDANGKKAYQCIYCDCTIHKKALYLSHQAICKCRKAHERLNINKTDENLIADAAEKEKIVEPPPQLPYCKACVVWFNNMEEL